MRERRIACGLGLLLFVSYAYFFQGGGWNPNSRLDLTRAIAERGTVRIDAYVANTGDWSQYDGHYYANKAPGFSFAAVPVWMATGALAPTATVETRAWWANAILNGGLSAALGVALFFVLGSLGIASAGVRAATTVAFGLGTLAFPYATAFYAHVPAAALAFLGFAGALRATRLPDARWSAFLGGLAAGAAVLFETSTMLVPLAIGLWLIVRRDVRSLALFAAGLVPAALVMSWYGLTAFHDPLARWTRWANPKIEVRINGALFGLPSPRRLWSMLFSGYRGLFFSSPVLLLAIPGWLALRRASAGAAFVCGGVVGAFLIMMSSFHAWHGGWAAGSRYLIPCLPFAAVPLGFGFAKWPRVGAVLGVASVAMMTAISLVAVEVPKNLAPFTEFAVPYLRDGRVSVNPQGLDDYMPDPGFVSMRPPENGKSSNLGELVFPGRPASILPLLAIWAALGFWILRQITDKTGRQNVPELGRFP